MSETKTKSRQVNIRLSDEEMARVLHAAENAGLSISAYVRKLAVGQKVKPMVIDREQGKQLIAALGKIGGNINQIAKVFTGCLSHTGLLPIRIVLRRLCNCVRTARKQQDAEQCGRCFLHDSSSVVFDKESRLANLDVPFAFVKML